MMQMHAWTEKKKQMLTMNLTISKFKSCLKFCEISELWRRIFVTCIRFLTSDDNSLVFGVTI